jgi:hypothetical protein
MIPPIMAVKATASSSRTAISIENILKRGYSRIISTLVEVGRNV